MNKKERSVTICEKRIQRLRGKCGTRKKYRDLPRNEKQQKGRAKTEIPVVKKKLPTPWHNSTVKMGKITI